VPRHQNPGHSKCVNATVYVFDLRKAVVMAPSK